MSHRFTINLPDDVYTALKDQATRDHRTLSQQITHILSLRMDWFIPHNTPGGMQTYSTPENPTGQSYTPTNQIKRKEII